MFTSDEYKTQLHNGISIATEHETSKMKASGRGWGISIFIIGHWQTYIAFIWACDCVLLFTFSYFFSLKKREGLKQANIMELFCFVVLCNETN